MTDETFDAYWLRFVRDHSRAGTQWMHLIGNAVSVGLLVSAIRRRSIGRALLAPLPALAASRISHRWIEQNTPLSAAEHPRWFLACELRMARLLLTGGMKSEVRRALEAPRG